LRQKTGKARAGSHRAAAPRAQEIPRVRNYSGPATGPLFAAGAGRPRPRAPGFQGGWKISTPAGSCGGAYGRVSVDTRGASDRLEIRKTCGISIGSASFAPPEKARRRSFDGHRSGFGRRSLKRTGSPSMEGRSTKTNGGRVAFCVAVADSNRRRTPPIELRKRSPNCSSRGKSGVAGHLCRSVTLPSLRDSKCGMRFAHHFARKGSRPAGRPANEETAK
jgi:hypothetical protein